MFQRLLAAVNPFLSFENEDHHHLSLRPVLGHPASIECDLDVKKVLPAVPPRLHAHRPHLHLARLRGGDRLHYSTCLHLHSALEVDAVTVGSRNDLQIGLSQSHDAFLCFGHLLIAGKAVPKAGLVQDSLHPSVRLDGAGSLGMLDGRLQHRHRVLTGFRRFFLDILQDPFPHLLLRYDCNILHSRVLCHIAQELKRKVVEDRSDSC